MALYSKSLGTQTEKSDEFPYKQLKKCGQIYNQRKDIKNIKARLEALVSNANYWSTVSKFIYGELTKTAFDEAMEIYLPNKNAKILHNQYLRIILFNAHFSSIPPPNFHLSDTQIAKKNDKSQNKISSNIQNFESKKTKPIQSYSSADIKHIPSLYQLKLRLANMNTSIDEKGLQALFKGIKSYTSLILKESISLNIKNYGQSTPKSISPYIVFYAIQKNPTLKSVISNAMMAKWQIVQTTE